jgi:hypothetical protein
MAKQSINIGSSANDGQGDALRTAFDKVNDNFTDLYEGGTNNVNVVTIGKDTAVGGAITLTGSAVSQSGNTFTINTSAGQGNSGALQYNNGGAVAGANDILYTSGILKVTNTIEARGDGTNAGKLKLYCEATSSSHAITIEGPAHSGASSYNLKLPGAAPGNTQILQSNGSGQLSWINTPSGSGGSTLSISNNGSALSTNATSINFVGNGVTASGTGATKTVTIPGVGLSQQDDKKFLYNNSGSVASSSLLSLGSNEVIIGDVAGEKGILRLEGSESASAYVKIEGTTATKGVILTVDGNISSDYTITFPQTGPQDNNKILQSNSSGQLSWIATPTGSTYTLPLASSSTRGGIKIGYTQSAKKYPVELFDEAAYVDVPWTDTNTTYSVMNSYNSYSAGLVPQGNASHNNAFLRKDGTFHAVDQMSGNPNGTGFGDSVLNIAMTSTSTGNYTALSTECKTYQGHKHVTFYLNPSGTTTLSGSISQAYGAVAYNTTSDYRLKENVVEMTGAVNRVKQLKPSRFNWTAFPNATVDGFLAHEIQTVVPEAVSGEKDQVDENGQIQPQGIDQSKLVPLLVGAIKELTARIEALEA